MADEKDAQKDEKPESAGTDELLKARAAAEFLGISERRLHRLRKRGEITAVRLGWRRYGFPTSALMAYVSGVADRMAPVAEPSTAESPTYEIPVPESTRDAITETLGQISTTSETEEYEATGGLPLIALVNYVLLYAIERGASDIHVEPDRHNIRFRGRIDGVLRELMMLPKHVQSPFLQRLRVMADLKLTVMTGGRAPQVGSIPIKLGEDNYNLRVSCIPAQFGDNIVIRVYDGRMGRRTLSSLGLYPEGEEAWFNMTFRRGGLMPMTGNLASGKTTTAYATLSRLNNIEQKLFTVEDVRTYDMPGVIQVQASLNVALKNLLQQDPDVLFVGDISMEESANAALEATASGVLVLATLSSVDAISAVQRLTGMGPHFPSRVSRLVTGVLAQDLVRRICPDCREEYESDTRELQRYLPGYAIPDTATLYRGKGCEACSGTGYRGRIGIFELLSPKEDFWERLAGRKHLADSLRDVAYASFVSTFGMDVARKLLEGLTTIEEARRIMAKRPAF